MFFCELGGGGGDKLQLQEVQSAVPLTVHTEDLSFKEAENYGKSL